ncbi:uncharacterized protein LOC118434549 [Folsomia candida]|uniref:uncharacterized protein LOC118434549 n=1 Tax=Folsomia candida TaxID=158441 RepID=UPI001604FD8E|nr:uncharacterized protein LOC118434549 [Folsomia candida]
MQVTMPLFSSFKSYVSEYCPPEHLKYYRQSDTRSILVWSGVVMFSRFTALVLLASFLVLFTAISTFPFEPEEMDAEIGENLWSEHPLVRQRRHYGYYGPYYMQGCCGRICRRC